MGRSVDRGKGIRLGAARKRQHHRRLRQTRQHNAELHRSAGLHCSIRSSDRNGKRVARHNHQRCYNLKNLHCNLKWILIYMLY